MIEKDKTGIAFYPRPCYNDSATKSLCTDGHFLCAPNRVTSVLAFRSGKKVPAREGAFLLRVGQRSTRYGTVRETPVLGRGGYHYPSVGSGGVSERPEHQARAKGAGNGGKGRVEGAVRQRRVQIGKTDFWGKTASCPKSQQKTGLLRQSPLKGGGWEKIKSGAVVALTQPGVY